MPMARLSPHNAWAARGVPRKVDLFSASLSTPALAAVSISVNRLPRPIARLVRGASPDTCVLAARAIGALKLLLAASAGRGDQRLPRYYGIVAMVSRGSHLATVTAGVT